MIDRAELSRLLASAIANKLAGKPAEANAKAVLLINALRRANILTSKES